MFESGEVGRDGFFVSLRPPLTEFDFCNCEGRVDIEGNPSELETSG